MSEERDAMRAAAVSIALWAVVVGSVGPQPPAARPSLVQNQAVAAALAAVKVAERRSLTDQGRYCERPAPPCSDAAREQVLQAPFVEAELHNGRRQAVGNRLAVPP